MTQPSSASQELNARERVRATVDRHLADWVLEDINHENGDFVLSAPDGETFVVEMKRTSERRIDTLLGLASRSVLQSQYAATRMGARPMIAVSVPVAGRKAVQRMSRFMAQYAADVSWLLVDDREACEIHVPPLGLEISSAGRVQRHASSGSASSRRSLFTDLRRWLLKIVLLADVDDELWAGPGSQAHNPLELARLADVSPQTAYDLISDAHTRGLLSSSDDVIRVVSPRSLFDLWFAHEKQTVRRVVPVRSLFGDVTDVHGWLRERAHEHVVVGGRKACQLLGVEHVVGTWIPELYFRGNEPEIVDALEVDPCRLEDAEFLLIPTRYSESVFRGAVDRDGVRVVDILQAALDMAFHDVRGREQADFIVDNVLGWR